MLAELLFSQVLDLISQRHGREAADHNAPDRRRRETEHFRLAPLEPVGVRPLK